MTLPITALLACALTILCLILIKQVVAERQATKTSLGDGGEASLERKIRAHGNLTENAPLFVILIGIAELHADSSIIVAVLALAFVLGRIAHGYALAFTENFPKGRFLGMVTTLTTTSLAVLYNLFLLVA